MEAVASEDLGTEHQASTHPTRRAPTARRLPQQGAAGAETLTSFPRGLLAGGNPDFKF